MTTGAIQSREQSKHGSMVFSQRPRSGAVPSNPSRRVQGPISTGEQVDQPGSQYRKKTSMKNPNFFTKKPMKLRKQIPSHIEKSQHSDEEINLNEGVVYTAGGIGVKTQAEKENHLKLIEKQASLNQRVDKLNRTSSIASLGLNERSSTDGNC